MASNCTLGIQNLVKTTLNNKPWFQYDQSLGIVNILDSFTKKINKENSHGVAKTTAITINKQINDGYKNIGDIAFVKSNKEGRGYIDIAPTINQIYLINAQNEKEINELQQQLDEEELLKGFYQTRETGNYDVVDGEIVVSTNNGFNNEYSLNNFQEEQKELDKIVTKINNESRQLDLFESFQNIITNENKPTPIDTTKSAGLLWGKMSSYESETNFQPTESKSQYRSDNSLQEKINGRSFKEIWNSNEFTQLERENILLHSIQKRMLDKNSFNGELFAGINSKLGKLELRVVDNEKYPFLAFQKQIYINPKTFLKYLQNANIEDVDKYLDLTVSEELIHVLTNYFTSLEDIKKIATEINPNNFKYIQSIYKSLPSGDFELGTREYLRMIVQQEILGTTTEKIKYTKNGVIDSIIDKIWNFLYQIFKDNKGTLAENVKKHIDFIKSNNVDSTNNYKSDIFQVETSLSQNIKYQLSKEQSDAIDNVFDENPELANSVYSALGFTEIKSLSELKPLTKELLDYYKINPSLDIDNIQNVNNILTSISKNSPWKHFRNLASIYLNYTKEIPYRLEFKNLAKGNGIYLKQFRLLEIENKLLQVNNDLDRFNYEMVILHEMTHGLTLYGYNTNKEFKNKVDKLFDFAKLNTANKTLYGLTSPEEFLAEILVNPDFQKEMNNISYDRKNTVLTFFNSLIKELLNSMGIKFNENSVLSEAIDLSLSIIPLTKEDLKSYKDIDFFSNQIIDKQKQQAQQLYSQYLEQNPNGSVEQFKSWVNNRNDLYYQVKNIFNTVKELEDKLKSLNKTANSIGSEKNIDDILKKAGLESDFRKEFLQLLKDNPSLKSLKLSEVISSYLKEFVKESDRQYYTAIEEPLSEELENVLIDYFDKFHIRRKQLDNLKEKFGVDSIGIFDVLAKTIYYSKNRNLLTLPEEYGHVFVELLGSISNKKADNPLFKYLFDNIESWDGYQRVFRDYKNLYVTAEGNIDIYKIKKEAIGQAIGIALVRNYKVQKGDKGFWSKIQEVIDYILGLIKGIDYVSLNTTVDSIAKDILSNNYSKLDRLNKDTSNYNLLSYSETLKTQNKKDGGKALKFMQWFSQKGMIITGSLAYRLQGNVYRPEIDALHDIDNIVPSDVHKLNLNKSNFLNEEQLEKDKIYRNLITEGNYKEAKQYKIQGNLKLGLNDVLDQVEVLKDFKKEFPDTDFLYSFFNQKANAYYVTINAIWSENQELKDRFKSYSGSFNNRLANFTEEELSQLYLFDFFLRPETSTQYKQIEDKEYGLNLAHFNYSFYEKLNMMGRAKDAYDYQMWNYFDENNILAPDFNDRLVYFQINQSQQKQNQIQEVFNKNPELSKIGTVEQYASYLDTIFPDSKVVEMDNSLYISVLNQLEQEDKIEKDCSGKLKAEKGLQTNFTKNGEWKIIKDLKGYPTHKEGGVDLTIGKNGVSIKNGNTEFTAKHGLVLPNNFGNPIEFEAMSKVLSQRNKHLNWVDRGLNPDKYPKIDNQDGTFSTHRLAYSTGDNGEAYVYPTIILNDKGELVQLDDNAAWEYARETNTAMRIPNVKLAEYYSQNGLIKH